jgi:hypothetical protein
MPDWAWIVIALGALVVLGLIVWMIVSRRKTAHLRERFGPEYDRTLESADKKREAEKELAAREERREELDIRPLSQAAHDRYVEEWQTVQARFVDDPSTAVRIADSLIKSVMAERGYPVDDFDQRADDLSVDHPHVVENYREGHRLAEQNADGSSSTEELRQAMQHYRALFEELVTAPADEPTASERGLSTSEPDHSTDGHVVKTR